MAEQEKPDQRCAPGTTGVPRNKPLHYVITDQFRYQLMASTNNVDVREQLRVLPPVRHDGIFYELIRDGFVKADAP